MKRLNVVLTILLCSAYLFTGCTEDSTSGIGKTYDIKLVAKPNEGGRVSPSSLDYQAGDTLQIEATAASQWVFSGWTGVGDDSLNSTTTIVVDGPKTITANFVRKEYELTVHTEGEGTVEESILKQPQKKYLSETEVLLTAKPNEGWEFVQWKGALNGTENPDTLFVDSPKEVTAVFEPSGSGSGVPTAIEPSAGDGSEANPYEINSIVNLVWMSENPSSSSSYFVQTANIDASGTSNAEFNEGKGFVPIGGDDAFKGNYDGQGYVISDLYINRPATTGVGLFIRIQGTVKNVHLKNANITGGSYTGGVAGVIESEGSLMMNVSVSGQVTGIYRTGGLAGACIGPDAKIAMSYNSAVITGENASGSDANQIGGISGFVQECTVRNVYNTGDITGNYDNGGIAGSTNAATIQRTYNAGSVQQINGNYQSHNGGIVGSDNGSSTFQNNYFDSDVTGSTVASGIGGTAKTTSDMKTQSTFTGFDFSSTWAIDEGNSYPYLQNNSQDPKPGVE